MSTQVTQLLPEQVFFVHCTFCNTILAVSVPSNSTLSVVTVRCGHCFNHLSVNMGGLLHQTPTRQNHQKMHCGMRFQDTYVHNSGSTSECKRLSSINPMEGIQQRMFPLQPPEKRQRVPSAYNKFIKVEIKRIKANNPGISHREAFSAAAKNWAHFPHIDFGITLDGNKK